MEAIFLDRIRPERHHEEMSSLLRALQNPRQIVVLLQGFMSGLPLLLVGGTLRAWMQEAGVDLTLIGFFAAITVPYSCKFLWAPFLDRFEILGLGRRRGWLLVSQAGLALSLVAMAVTNPAANPLQMAIMAFMTSFFAASQDIVIDAYRREVLKDEEMGLGVSLAVTGYRIGLLIGGSVALVLADQVSWMVVYILMAALVLVGLIATFFCPEPQTEVAPPRSMLDAVIHPFLDYFKRADAFWILAFIFFYKIGDSMASDMLNPFYLQVGFTKTEIGLISKPVGVGATILGGLVGGALLLRIQLKNALLSFGILQAVTTLLLAGLAIVGPHLGALTGVVFFETFARGMGSAAFVAFMMQLTNKKFTGTQYALLSSFMGLPRAVFGASTGFLAKHLGWEGFFVVCTLLAVPALLMLRRYSKWTHSS